MRRPVVDVRIVVLHIELPGDTAFLEAVEDGGDVIISLGGDTTASLLAADPEHMVSKTATMIRAKETIEEHILVHQVPIIRQVAIVIVAHRQGAILISLIQRVDEAIHQSFVVLEIKCAVTVIQVFNRAFSDMERLYTLCVFLIERIDWYTCSRREAIRTRIRAEIVIECVILLHQNNKMLDCCLILDRLSRGTCLSYRIREPVS